MTGFQKFLWFIAAAVFFGMVLATLFTSPGCDTSQATPYKELYEQQLIVNDSLKIHFLDTIDQLSFVANKKIDSLKGVESQLRVDLYNCQQAAVCDTGAILRAYGEELNQYLFIPLNSRLVEIIDSLNTK